MFFTGSKNKAWQPPNRSSWRLLSDTEEYGQLSLTERVSKRSAAVGDLLRIGDLWNEQTKEAFSRLTRTKNKLSAHDHAAGKDRVATCVDGLDEEVRYKEPILFHNRMNNWSKRNVLSSDEWDFRGISKPEIWICWNYEFAREAVRMDSRLLRPTTEWRAGAPESFQERLKYLKQHPFISIGGWLGLLSPEWPDRSYLFLESDERISRIEQLRKYYSTLPASPIAAHLRNPLIPVKSRVDWDLIGPMLEDQLNRSPDKMSIPNVTVGEGSDQVSTVILQLDWSRGRTEILRAFGDLLSKMEAQDMKAQDPRGGGTELDHRAAELRALGGLRIKRFESSITDCKSYYNLYETIGAYYKAEEKAVKITRKYFVSIFSDKKAVLRP